MGVALATCCSVPMSVHRPSLMESPRLGGGQKSRGSTEAMALSWNSMWNRGSKMLEEGSHPHRKASWKGPRAASRAECTHTTFSSPGRREADPPGSGWAQRPGAPSSLLGSHNALVLFFWAPGFSLHPFPLTLQTAFRQYPLHHCGSEVIN